MLSFLKSESEGEDVVDVPGVADIPPVQRLQEELPSEESDPEVEEPNLYGILANGASGL